VAYSFQLIRVRHVNLPYSAQLIRASHVNLPYSAQLIRANHVILPYSAQPVRVAWVLRFDFVTICFVVLSSVQLTRAIRWFIVVSFMTLSAYDKASSCGGFTVLGHWWVDLISALADVLFACYYDFRLWTSHRIWMDLSLCNLAMLIFWCFMPVLSAIYCLHLECLGSFRLICS